MFRVFTSIDIERVLAKHLHCDIGSLLRPFFEMNSIYFVIRLDAKGVGFDCLETAIVSVYSVFGEVRNNTKATRIQHIDVFFDFLSGDQVQNTLIFDSEFRHEFSGPALTRCTQTISGSLSETLLNDSGKWKVSSDSTLSVDCFKAVGLGGSFNFLHSGHKKLLSVAATLSKKVFVGVTAESLTNKKSESDFFESFEARKLAVQRFLMHFRPDIDLEFVTVLDGMTGWDLPIECLVVSQETANGVPAFNNRRIQAELQPIKGVTVPLLQDDISQNRKTSSSFFRKLVATKSESAELFSFVKQKFIASAARLAANPSNPVFSWTSEVLFTRLTVFYSEEHRFYHTLVHVADCLAKADKHFPSLAEHDRALLDLSLIYHDVIYVPGLPQNEELSAKLLESDAQELKLNPKDVMRCVELVMLTKKHEYGQEDALGKLMTDLDLSILADNDQKYTRYTGEIRQEFRAYDDKTFCTGRIAFLEQTKSKKCIFWAQHLFSEEQFRRNADGEITRLSQILSALNSP